MRTCRSTLIAFAVLLSGCAILEQADQREEASQLAWHGPGPGPCLFGGVTERAVEHCAFINFGAEGVLVAINAKAQADVGGADSRAHVEALQRELARYRELRSVQVYSCPDASRSPECHFSLLVISSNGERFVIDDGVIIRDTVGVNGVASLAAFEEAVGSYWTGVPSKK